MRLPLHQLQMDVQRIERITNLVCNAGGEQRKRIQSLRLNNLLRGAPALGNIAQDHGVADLFAVTRGRDPGHFSAKRSPFSIAGVSDSSQGPSLTVFDHQGHDVKIDEAICRIKNFHVATDRLSALSERFPIETTDAVIEPFPDGVARAEPKQLAGRIIKVSNAASRIGHNDAFLNGVENGLEEAFLLRQTQKIILHLFRPNASESLD